MHLDGVGGQHTVEGMERHLIELLEMLLQHSSNAFATGNVQQSTQTPTTEVPGP